MGDSRPGCPCRCHARIVTSSFEYARLSSRRIFRSEAELAFALKTLGNASSGVSVASNPSVRVPASVRAPIARALCATVKRACSSSSSRDCTLRKSTLTPCVSPRSARLCSTSARVSSTHGRLA